MKMKEKKISITNIIKSRVLPFFIIFGLILNFSVSKSFASAIPSGYFVFDDLLTSFGVGSVSSIDSFVSDHIEDYPFIVVFSDSWQASNVMIYMFDNEPFYNDSSDRLFGDSLNYYILYADNSAAIYPYYYSSNSFGQDLYNHSFGSMYFGFELPLSYGSSVTGYLEPNLDISSFLPDNRFLTADKVDRFGVEYLEIVTSDLDFGLDSFVTINALSGSTPFTYTYGPSSFIDVSIDPPYTYFYVNPLATGYTAFNINSVEYENRYGEFGSLTIPTSLSFGVPISNVPANYDVNTTINSFTQFVDEGAVSYGLDTLYLGSDSITGQHLYWSSSDVPTRQKWELKALFVPNPSFLQHYTGQDTLSSSTAYQIFEQFDLIVFNVDDDAFDYIYGSGQFSILDNITTGLDFDLLVKKCVELSTDYSNLRMDELAPTTILYSDSDCGFVFTRSYLLKKMYFFMGDIDTRLLEFETNLVSENGVLAAVQTKLANIVTNNSSFFDPALEDLTNIVYFCNDISLNGYLPAMVSSLGSIDTKLSLLNYLTSIDNKLGLIDLSNLSYLTNLSSIASANSSMASDLTYISSDSANIWDFIDGYFPNFYDYLFDIEDNTDEIISILYDMHETIIVDMDLPTIIFNDGNLVDFGNWINDWIVVLPEFDFSDFPNFFSNANNLVTDLAGQNDDLIGSLDDPYTYSDSEVHSLGWD